MLRDYQQRAIDQLCAWFEASNEGNPCLVLPTGSGKSHIIAALCKNALQNWPETQILMLTHQKELIEQNASKLHEHWPDAPLGIYSASVGRKELGEPITFAGIQSIRKKAADVGHVDLVIIDECHLVGHKEEGGYRTFLAALKAINPAIRVIGCTASPWRLGHGLITDKPALFDALIEPTSIEELIFKGYLTELRSKVTSLKLDVKGVHKRGGEYIESELQAAVDNHKNNSEAVREMIRLGEDRKSWLVFCSGVKHANNVADLLDAYGIIAAPITGETPKAKREQLLADFKAGKIRCLTNANVLTTGFDHPGIDMIALMRPTMSPGLYVQMAGRGLRIAEGKKDCLVLDFAGVVSTHGPITAVQPPKKGGEGNGEAPVKVCDKCNELCHLSAKVCPACGHEFPAPEPKKLKLRDDDIMGLEGKEMKVSYWKWRRHVSRASGKEMLAVTYYGSLSDKPITEYLPVLHDGYVGSKAIQKVYDMAAASGADLSDAGVVYGSDALDYLMLQMNISHPPKTIKHKTEGRFHRVTERRWI